MRRFVQAFSVENFTEALSPPVREELSRLPPRYNISIGQSAGVLFLHEVNWKIAGMTWGLVPSWEPAFSTRYSTQTSRLERAPRSRLFRSSWLSRRCVVPMNGYYKWDRESSPRQPYFIQAGSGEVLFAAALWSRWGEDAEVVQLSFSILTHPNAAIPPPLVPDGPLFVSPSRIGEWIQAPADAASRMLRRERQPRLEVYPVSRRVANRKLDDYSLLEPADPRESAAADLDLDEIEDDD